MTEGTDFYFEKLAKALSWLNENPTPTMEEAKAFVEAERQDIERFKKEQECQHEWTSSMGEARCSKCGSLVLDRAGEDRNET